MVLGRRSSAEHEPQNFTVVTNVPFTQARVQKRIEGKLTGNITQGHNLVVSYVDVKDKDGGNFFGSILDTRSLNDRKLPNKLFTGASSRGLSPFNPFTATPIECPADASAATCTSMGANYQKATTFGKAVGVNSYQTARTYSFATGIRF